MTPRVDAPCGSLRGARDGSVIVFRGIPFAAPPAGWLRWKPPQPLPRWDGERDATRFAMRCIQHAPYGELEPGSPGQSEDCLYLNVWTPDTDRDARLPVIFWIHGGEFWAGSGSEPRHDGAALAARGAVVVTINYRLGVFGFLSHPELSAESEKGLSGNYGLLDQLAALAWTRANISAFGGDPDAITIAGESAGSCSVSFLMATPLARGMFRGAIGESCAYFMPEPHTMKPLPLAENEARGVEFLARAGANSIAELRAMPAAHLLDTRRKELAKRMQPCLDGHVLPQVDEAFARGAQAPVPLLCGWNGDEYGFLRAGRARFDIDDFANRLRESFGHDADRVRQAYAHDDPVEAFTRLTGDRAMVWPTWKWAETHAARFPVFAYQFDRAPPGSAFGATHACEIEYVFGALDSKPRPYEDADRALSQRIGDYWVNFARSGDPNAVGLPHWPRYDRDRCVMHLDATCEARPLVTRERLELLDQVYARVAS